MWMKKKIVGNSAPYMPIDIIENKYGGIDSPYFRRDIL